jgi:hypothetical protein
MNEVAQSRSAKLEQVFVGDGYYDLCLRVGELVALQEKVGAGPHKMALRLYNGDWFVEDITETLRLALIGGGLKHKEAFELVQSYVREGYFMDYASLAGAALMAALQGVEDEPLETPSGEAMAPTMEEDSSSGASSTSSEGPQDSPPPK